jgi:hypothetical protein
MKPTICFATMCRDEENCILDTLNSIYKYIDYWVICDTGSTDKTVDIINTFFKDKNIKGELYIDEWVGFGHNKTLLLNRCYKKTDFVIHFDADDILEGDLDISSIDTSYIAYNINFKRGKFIYKNHWIMNNNYEWKVNGVAHNAFVCMDNYENKTIGDLTNKPFHILSRNIGNRSQNKDKYMNDALLLKKQFKSTLIMDDDNLNLRSVFYTAQSYFDSDRLDIACEWYCLYIKLKNTRTEEVFESYKRIVYCLIMLDYPFNVILNYAKKGIELFSDRAEIYYIMGKYFLKFKKYELAFFNIQKAFECNLSDVKKKYELFIDIDCYKDNLYDLLYDLAINTNREDYAKTIRSLSK